MRIPRFLIPASSLPSEKKSSFENAAVHFERGTEIILSDEESHHLRSVLRISEGESIEVFCPELRVAFLCQVTDSKSKACACKIIETIPEKTPASISLLVGNVKSGAIDQIVEKCVELGVSEIYFFQAERSQGGLATENRRLRLERIRNAALKQSRSTVVTGLNHHESLEEALKSLHSDNAQIPSDFGPNDEWRLLFLPEQMPGAIADPGVSAQPPVITRVISRPQDRDLANTSLENIAKRVDSYVLVGPEGGFTDAERELAGKYQYRQTSLGPFVLRTETAAIVACSAVQLLRA